MDTLILADPERRAVNEADTRTFAQQHFLDEECQGNSNLLLQFHKAVIGYQFWEQVTEMVGDMFQIVMLQATGQTLNSFNKWNFVTNVDIIC